MTSFTFRISPDDPCQIEWRRNEIGAMWLYWCRRATPEEAQAALLGIEQVGFITERQEAIGLGGYELHT